MEPILATRIMTSNGKVPVPDREPAFRKFAVAAGISVSLTGVVSFAAEGMTEDQQVYEMNKWIESFAMACIQHPEESASAIAGIRAAMEKIGMDWWTPEALKEARHATQ